MKKEDLIKAIPTFDELYILFSAYTKSPFVVCDEKTFDDKAIFFLHEAEAVAFAKELTAEKIAVNVAKLENKEIILQTFTSFYLYGINAVEFIDGEERTLLDLSDFIRRPDISEIPEEQRPLENPSLNLTIMYFLQELRRQVEPPTSQKLRNLEEEMVVNLLRARYFLPFRPNEGNEEKPVQLLLIKVAEDKFMIPIFSDGYELNRFRGPEGAVRSTIASIDNLFSIVLPENTIGFILNPAGASLTLSKEWIEKIKSNRVKE